MKEFAVGLIAVVAGAIWLLVHDMDEMQRTSEEWSVKRRQAERMHEATPEAWSACREVCGSRAALLPAGDGSWWVNRSCLPPETSARTVPN